MAATNSWIPSCSSRILFCIIGRFKSFWSKRGSKKTNKKTAWISRTHPCVYMYACICVHAPTHALCIYNMLGLVSEMLGKLAQRVRVSSPKLHLASEPLSVQNGGLYPGFIMDHEKVSNNG